jgi:hypothetical protein
MVLYWWLKHVGIQKVVLRPKHYKIRHVDTQMVVYFIIPWYYNGVHIGFRVSIYIYIYMKAFQYCKSNQVKYHKIFYQSLSQKRNNQNWICARISLTSFLRYALKNTHVDHLDPLQLHIHASYSCGNGMIFLEIQKSPKSTHDHEKNISKFFNTLVQYKTSL